MTIFIPESSWGKKGKRDYKQDFHLAMLAAGLKPVTEYKFSAARRWSFDWAFPAAKLAIEYEGGVWGIGKKCNLCGQRRSGGHHQGERIKRDAEKYNTAAIFGWSVLKIYVHDVGTASAIEMTLSMIKRALILRKHQIPNERDGSSDA